MRKVFLFEETLEALAIANQTYEPIFATLKKIHPEAKNLVDHPELAQLHGLWVLLRSEQIKLTEIDSDLGTLYLLEIQENHQN